MPSFLRKLLLPFLLLVSLPTQAARPEKPNLPAIPNLPALSHNSGYIFTGTVKAVEFEGGSVATVRITFHVNQGIRGVRSGQTLTIREWFGLWHVGERYRVGERVALFLYPPSKLGLTSPVGGASGRFSLDPGGRIVVTPVGNGRPPIRGTLSQPTLVDPRDLVNVLGRPEEE